MNIEQEKTLRHTIIDVGEKEEALCCPVCSSTCVVKDGKAVNHPRGSTEPEIYQRYRCVSCGKKFSDRKHRGLQYSQTIIKLALRMQHDLGNKRIAAILRDVFNITVNKHTIGRWRAEYGPIYAWHSWKREGENFRCRNCDVVVTLKQIKSSQVLSCKAKIVLREKGELKLQR